MKRVKSRLNVGTLLAMSSKEKRGLSTFEYHAMLVPWGTVGALKVHCSIPDITNMRIVLVFHGEFLQLTNVGGALTRRPYPPTEHPGCGSQIH